MTCRPEKESVEIDCCFFSLPDVRSLARLLRSSYGVRVIAGQAAVDESKGAAAERVRVRRGRRRQHHTRGPSDA